MNKSTIAFSLLGLLAGCAGPVGGDEATSALSEAAAPSLTAEMPSTSGKFQTFSTSGTIDTGNAFFQSLGSNGRACVHCHQAQDGWSVLPAHLVQRFNATTPKGIDPIFRTNDGSNSPRADVSTLPPSGWTARSSSRSPTSTRTPSRKP